MTPSPAEVTLACGHRIPNTGGVKVWNYYDMVWTTTQIVSRPDIDTSGRLPNGVTYWITSSADCSRATCEKCGG
jgi:hypothetical protein